MTPRKPPAGSGAPNLRAVEHTMTGAVEATLEALETLPEDAALIRLARSLAAAVDADDRQGVTLAELSSKLLAVLVQLGATPASRKDPKVVTSGGGTRLEALRAARRPS
jgi:hypothetical protein